MRPNLENDDFNEDCLYRAARVYALASVQVTNDASEPERERLSKKLADRAVELLGKAIAKGWKKVDEVRSENDFRALRAHPGFQKILADIDAVSPEASALKSSE